MFNTIARTLSMGAATLALAGAAYAGTATASATPMPQVCTGIDESATYQGYLISAWALGYSTNSDQHQQAINIVDSVKTYCPWHLSGIYAAATTLSQS